LGDPCQTHGGEGRLARWVAGKGRAGDDECGEGVVVDPDGVVGAKGEIGGVVAVKDSLGVDGPGFDDGEGIARLARDGADMGGVDGVAVESGKAEATDGVIRDAGQKRCAGALAGQGRRDVGGRAAERRGEAGGGLDPGAHGVGVKIHSHAAKDGKAVQPQALQGGLHPICGRVVHPVLQY
jgi:hypothetical protein